MSDRFYGSRYGKHSTYYGMNDSSLYGSNFSSVFADAPPPLEDFHEEDDDMVFRNSGKSLAENGGTTAVKVKSETKIGSPDTEFKLVSNGNSNGNNDEEFGDFSGFADFKSAFTTSSCDPNEREDWFGEPNKEPTPSGTDSSKSWPSAATAELDEGDKFDSKRVKEQSTCSNDFDADDDFADFAGFDGAEHQKNNLIFGSVYRDSEIESSCLSSPLSPIMDVSNKGLSTKLDKKSTGDSETQLSKNHDSLGDGDWVGSGAQLSDERNLVQNDSTSSQSNMPENGFVGSESKNSKLNQGHLQLNLINKKGEDEDDFGSFMSTRSLSPENDFDAFAMENSDQQINCSKQGLASAMEQRNRPDESDKTLPEDDDFGEFSAVETQSPSVDFPATENRTSSDNLKPCKSESKESINDNGGNLQTSVKGDLELPIEQLESHPNSSKMSLNFEKTEEPEKISDKHSSIVNENSMGNEEQIDDTDEFGDFAAVSKSTDGFDTGIQKQADGGVRNKETEGLSKAKRSNDAPIKVALGDNIENIKNTQEKVSEDNFDKMSSHSDERFGDFKVMTFEQKTPKQDGESTNKDNDFGESGSAEIDDFGDFKATSNPQEFQKSDENMKRQDNGDSDFGDFGAFDEKNKDEKSSGENDEFGDFSVSGNNSFGNFNVLKHEKSIEKTSLTVTDDKLSKAADADDDFGGVESKIDNFAGSAAACETSGWSDFSASKQNSAFDRDSFGDFSSSNVLKHEESFEKTSNSVTDEAANADDFGAFGSIENKIDNFADFTATSETSGWSDFSASKQNSAFDRDNFGDFSSSGSGTVASVEFASFSSSSDSSTFGSLGASAVKDKAHKEKREPMEFRSSTHHSIIHKHESESAASGATWSAVPHKSQLESVFKPGGKAVMLQAGKPLVAAFASLGQLSGRGMKINSLGIKLSSSSVSGMWNEIQVSERNGSLRFQWLSCHSRYKQLLSLDIVPDSLPVTSLLTPGGEGQESMLPFMAGPGFVVEPSSGPVTNFRAGVKDVDPSQDPFGAPPEVALPDLSFVFGKSKYPDFKPANHNSMALDLDFLTAPSTPELASKQEHKSIYDEDLLGLDMQFSLDPQGQFKLPSAPSTPSPQPSRGKDSNKVFKFGNVTIPLAPQDSEQQLSNKAKEVVAEIEDLSFMLSSVLMFPLKSR